MAVSANSRYANNSVAVITGEDGVARSTLMPAAPVSRALTVIDYTWRAEDRVDLLAARVFGDETLWWVIGQANPEILDWLAVTPGTVVRIPRGGV